MDDGSVWPLLFFDGFEREPNYWFLVVFTGGNYVGDDPSEETLARFILPSVR